MKNSWTPNVGDKVRIIGHPHADGVGEIASGDVDATGWYWVRVRRKGFDVTLTVHIRNLDRILEDERKGLPRPPIKAGDEVAVVFSATVFSNAGRLWVHGCSVYDVDDQRVRQIERRVQNLGREARKED